LIEASLQKGSKSRTSDVRTSSKDVFIVHGRDVSILAQVEAFLRKLRLKPIILQDMPNMGQSLLGKIRTNSNVAYAVVLLTGDDEGRLNVVGNKNASPELKPRARQNVIFELGFFLAQLGNDHVTAIYQDGVDIPSDFLGIMYISWDENGSWQMKLFKELQAAGLSVDANSVFK
jgi:predicted nucleotide-binding protein